MKALELGAEAAPQGGGGGAKEKGRANRQVQTTRDLYVKVVKVGGRSSSDVCRFAGCWY